MCRVTKPSNFRRTRVYVAGPISASNVLDTLSNLRRGIELSYDLVRYGYAPFSPFLDFQYALCGPMALKDYYDLSLAWLDASDVMLDCLPGADDSQGVRTERAYALRRKIPIFRSTNALKNEVPTRTWVRR